MNTEPEIHVDTVSGAVRVTVRPRLGWKSVTGIGSAAFGSWLIWSEYHHQKHSLWLLIGPVIAAFGLWNTVRSLFSEEIIEISPREIVFHRSWIFGGVRHFQASKVSVFGFGFDDERYAIGRHLCFTYNWHEIKFASGISEADSLTVLQAVGGIGTASASDPFGEGSKMITLGLNTK